MSGVQTPQQRLAELRDLRRHLDAEARKAKAAIAAQKPATRPRRSRHVVPECGSESAYQRHRYHGEVADYACLDAHALHEAERAAGLRPDPMLVRVGVAS